MFGDIKFAIQPFSSTYRTTSEIKKVWGNICPSDMIFDEVLKSTGTWEDQINNIDDWADKTKSPIPTRECF